MYEVEELKYEFAHKSSSSLCQACLSSDRSLSSIGEYIDVLRNISNIIIPQPLLLCWECIAILKKIKQFKEKIEEAQRILAYHYLNKQKLLLQTLSKLTKTYTDHTLIITYDDDDDSKEKIEIKEENQHSNDSFNFDDNDFCPQEIKKENQNVIDTKITKKKSLHYRIVYEKNSKRVLRKKFGIQTEDLSLWMEKERNSDFYKKFKYKCNFCINGFNSNEKLKHHVLKYHHESIGPHECPACSMRFTNEALLSTHTQTHDFAWECTRCGFQCYTVKRLNAHINTHSAVQCVTCEGKFKDLATFYTHYKSLHSIFLCDHCGKRCKTKYMIEKHMSRHLDTHTCATCSRQYKSRAALRKHCSAQHSACVAEQAYCVLCDKQYKSVHVYRRHVHTSAAHQKEREANKKVPCPECNNTYSRRAYMMNHYRHVHMNQSKYFCTECDRHFLNRTRYVDHMRYNHEGIKKEKNKLCNICGRGFAANRTLLNHMRTHSGERPYECEYCGATFTQRTSMLSHVKYIHMKSKRRPQWPQ
ncbi:hypothetical protein PYW08_012248 [Mythimna loreyi]|uniref:Uncharacterized protein n=1 Tax=Mythimna loreyi TaxID=667449 RepID=A0ACC2Q0H7_9NEOP|nr:hypothetical protein PYW08_012248 [Mythimna loreyi]